MTMTVLNETNAAVQHYYGQVLQSSDDLKTSACCSIETVPKHLKSLMANVHPEVQAKFYGCGSPLPPVLLDQTVVDLGCGAGRDCYVLAQLVGAKGQVLGVDMTDAQLAVAKQHQAWHSERFGYANVDFRYGFIEDLAALGIADESVDVVVSNCVINLSANKPKVMAEIFRVLKTGGELYFSDVFADRRVPTALQQDPVLLGECLAGAWYWEDFRRLLASLNCPDLRVVSSQAISIDDAEVAAKIGMVNFRSVTVRAFKVPLEDRCEDYGQVACYLGTVPEQPHAFVFDDHHYFETGRPMRVCGNTYAMLNASRYATHFQFFGDKQRHFGLFDCTPSLAIQETSTSGACC
ncbi:MAG: methyltransferase domain-containing protein [Methylococcaceae bacterium]|nr:MAG: methyltransferase domain-containing protein [Methylococcaceae bacterium]